ncbi:ABC transporter ATP-binding protein [Candidatus Auribacterota bacterium]
MKKNIIFRLLFSSSKKYLSKIIIINVLRQASMLITLGYLFIVKSIIDGGIIAKDIELIKRDLMIIFLLTLVREGMRYASDWLSVCVEENMSRDVQTKVYSHIISLPVAASSKYTTGRLMTMINNESAGVSRIVTQLSADMLEKPVRIILLLCVLFYFAPLLAGLALFFALPLIVLNKVIADRLEVFCDAYYDKKARIFSRIQEALSTLEVVKAFVREKKEAGKFEELTNSLIENDLKRTRVSLISSPAGEIVKIVVIAVIVLAGGYQVRQGAISSGTFVLIIISTMSFFGALTALFCAYTALINTFVGVKRISNVMSLPVEDKVESSKGSPLKSFEKIEFRDVSFSYEKDNAVLKDVSFTGESGSMLVFLGESGCGKTTLAKLLLRFYPPEKGRLLVNDNDIADHALTELREKTGLVFQEPVIYNASVYENIVLGRANADMKTVREAARIADIDDFIVLLKDGYETEVGTRGARLSGGQRQRITIARALLNDPDILVLDEATSFISFESEEKILSELKEKRAGQLTIVLTNRMSSLQFADRIYRFKEGTIVPHERSIAPEFIPT